MPRRCYPANCRLRFRTDIRADQPIQALQRNAIVALPRGSSALTNAKLLANPYGNRGSYSLYQSAEPIAKLCNISALSHATDKLRRPDLTLKQTWLPPLNLQCIANALVIFGKTQQVRWQPFRTEKLCLPIVFPAANVADAAGVR